MQDDGGAGGAQGDDTRWKQVAPGRRGQWQQAKMCCDAIAVYDNRMPWGNNNPPGGGGKGVDLLDTLTKLVQRATQSAGAT